MTAWCGWNVASNEEKTHKLAGTFASWRCFCQLCYFLGREYRENIRTFIFGGNSNRIDILMISGAGWRKQILILDCCIWFGRNSEWVKWCWYISKCFLLFILSLTGPLLSLKMASLQRFESWGIAALMCINTKDPLIGSRMRVLFLSPWLEEPWRVILQVDVIQKYVLK